MKKTIFSRRRIVNAAVSCIVIVTIFWCGACSSETAEVTVSSDTITYAKGLKKVHFVVVNDSSATIEMGQEYAVEKRDKRNNWAEIPLKYSWGDPLYTIAPGERHEFEVYISVGEFDTRPGVYDFQPGEYRIRKEYTIGEESKVIYYNFTIVE
jgi:hypothetical protein